MSAMLEAKFDRGSFFGKYAADAGGTSQEAVNNKARTKLNVRFAASFVYMFHSSSHFLDLGYLMKTGNKTDITSFLFIILEISSLLS
ncbi:hypothetical protein PACILC2_49470 [Paenibacillus cisolokensis]|uniref:Uncharacterized protein n=1 Tax=Paenibacillus cisolokensis TaxID=1658519 RepID=A0ABQ4NEK6_9BACL|nr:hypothetical protein [Paenibacillus cisolokensis]GIQ66379.1 hypothetical protein PACILC2_49470 [Paenibacillus cisolokensis]